MTTVLICDDHRQIREGLRQSVQTVPGVDRVDIAASGEEVLARWPAERQDLVLMDLQMPGLGGLETARRLVRQHPDANIVMLTGAADRDLVALAISGGARGYLHKDVSREELCAAVATALSGFALAAAAEDRLEPLDARHPELTERELQVLHGMAGGKSNAQIGRELYLSEDTIKTHARRLFRKLGVNDRAQAVASGFRLRLVR
jgi:DNA-binding NarL/FixJ family response regulator